MGMRGALAAFVGRCTHCKARKSDNDQRTSRYAFIHHCLGQLRKPPRFAFFIECDSFEHGIALQVA